MSAHFEGSSSASVAGSSTTISLPDGVLDGDLLIMLVSGTASLACTTPSGWTSRTPTYVTGPKVFCFSKLASSEAASYTIATSGSQSVTAIGYWRAADQSTPIDVAGGAFGNGNSTTPTAPTITPDTNGCQLIFCAGTANAPTFTAPTSFTNRVDAAISGTGAFSVYMADMTQSSAAATGSVVATQSISGNYNAFMLALKPLAGVSVNSVAPTISGSSVQGQTLTCDHGTWNGSPLSYEYQWTRNATDTVYTSTSATYATVLADRGKSVTCKVSARNASGLAGSVVASTSDTITVPTVPNLGKLKWQPPPQTNPITVDLTATGDTDYFATLTAGADYIIELSPTVPRTGLLEINANGAKSVKIIGGLWALNDGGTKNYHIHIHNLAGWGFIEGQEADMASTNADFISVAGSTLSQPGPYAPDVYIQNCRAVNLTATNATNHADVYQPQGKVHNVFIDRLTFSSNYDGLTIATDGSDGDTPPPPVGIIISRTNGWYSAANPSLPTTQFFWLNNANGTVNKDTAPFTLTFDDVWVDLVRGYGRANYNGQICTTIFPSVTNTGAGLAGGGNLVTGNGPSPFSHGELIGAQDSPDHSYAYFSNPKMLVTGILWSGSPDTGRSDVATDTDGDGSFAPVGIGSNYTSPGYDIPSPSFSVMALWNHRYEMTNTPFVVDVGLNLTIDVEKLWDQKYRDVSQPFVLDGLDGVTLDIEKLWDQRYRDPSSLFVVKIT